MNIQIASPADLSLLTRLDRHISPAELERTISLGRVYCLRDGDRLAGWLRYNLFWDNTPFLNLLFLAEDCRGHGYGGELLRRWEAEMARLGFRLVMTSTQSDEYAQHFYRHMGYRAVGGFALPGDVYELILVKEIGIGMA